MKQTYLCKKAVKYSYGQYNKIKGDKQAIRITEGCPHNCPWCYEPTEMKIFDIPEIVKNNVLIYDMNLLAKPESIDIIKNLPNKLNGKRVYYELVCGLDYRFLTEDIAKLLKRQGFINIRFAWDWTMKEQFRIKDTVDLLKRTGFKDIMAFMLCNWRIDINERIRQLDLLKIWNVKACDCWYDNQTSPNIQPVYWSPNDIKIFRKMVRKHNQLVNFGIDPEVKG